jgi:hypothetical protein
VATPGWWAAWRLQAALPAGGYFVLRHCNLVASFSSLFSFIILAVGL